jgi:fatty-acyl-CoA synthase
VASPSTQADRATAPERVLGIVRQLLGELSSESAIRDLDLRGLSAHLERGLGLGSLERVELMLRLGDAFHVQLPDKAVAEADTVEDLLHAVLGEGAGTGEMDGASPEARYHPGLAGTATTLAPRDLAPDLAAAQSLNEVLRLRAFATPEQAHIYFKEEDGKTQPITYAELLERANAVAGSLLLRGIQPGNTVAIMLPTCPEFFPMFFGILLAGAIPVPIYPPFRADRIEEYAARQSGILRNAEAKMLVTFQQAARVARLLQPKVPTLREVVTAARLVEDPGVSPSASVPGAPGRALEANWHQARSQDLALLQYTSGSTGDPKGVMLTHANLLANIRSIGEGIGIKPDDVAVSWLPLYHDMGLIGAWLVPLYFGVPLVVLSPLAFLSRPERWLWAIHHHSGTISPAPNFAYELCVRKIVDRDIEGLNLSSWRAALNGAEPVNPQTIERFVTRFAPYGLRSEIVLPVYGLAEASLGIAAPPLGSGLKVDRIARDPFEREGRAVAVAASAAPANDEAGVLEFASVGLLLPGTEVRLVDAEGRDVGERREGRLWFRSASGTQGYYRNPEATRAILCGDGWIDSGDLAYRAEGNLYITGRAKDIIIKGGRNIYPHEVEEITGRVNGVRMGCVVAFGLADEKSGTERLIVAAELRNSSARDRVAADITEQVAAVIGMPPDSVELLPPHSIPKTSSGKLRRSETKRLYLEHRLGKRFLPIWLQVAKLSAASAGPGLARMAGKGLRQAAEILYGVYALTVFGIVFPSIWAVVCIMPKRAAPQITRAGLRFMLALAGIRIRVENGELLNEFPSSGPWIIAANHTSYLDIFVMSAYLPAGARFVGKGEIRSMPLIRTFAKRLGHFAFDRSDPQARLEQAREIDAAVLDGSSVVIYPEGTFTPAPGVRPFQLGAFKAAVDTNRPICPAVVRGAREILRDRTILPRFGRITITFGPLILSQGKGWPEMVRLRDATRAVFAKNSGEPLL